MNDFTEDDAVDDDRLPSPHRSPTLTHIRKESIGEPALGREVACRDCPVSIWYWDGARQLNCFCSAMHQKTWGSGNQPVLFCDAREQEVAKLLSPDAISGLDQG